MSRRLGILRGGKGNADMQTCENLVSACLRSWKNLGNQVKGGRDRRYCEQELSGSSVVEPASIAVASSVPRTCHSFIGNGESGEPFSGTRGTIQFADRFHKKLTCGPLGFDWSTSRKSRSEKIDCQNQGGSIFLNPPFHGDCLIKKYDGDPPFLIPFSSKSDKSMGLTCPQEAPPWCCWLDHGLFARYAVECLWLLAHVILWLCGHVIMWLCAYVVM